VASPPRHPAGVPTGGQFAAVPRTEADVNLSVADEQPAAAALARAHADRMQMSDDPRTAARYAALARAAEAEADRSAEGRERAAAARRRMLDAENAAAEQAYQRRLALRAEPAAHRRAERHKTPEQLISGLSTPALGVALSSLKRSIVTPGVTRRIALIEAEMTRRRSGAAE
jgi:hypothetical protein